MAKKPVKTTPRRLVDLSNFLMALFAYSEAKGTKDPHTKKGVALYTRYMDTINEHLETYLDPVVKSGDIKRVKAKFKASKRGRGATRALAQGDFMGTALHRMSNRPDVLNGVFTGKSRTAIRDSANSIKQETPAAILHGLAAIPSISGLQTPRKWILEAAKRLGAGLTDFDQIVSDAESAVNLADEIKELDEDIRNGDPNDPKVVSKRSRRSKLSEKVQKVAETSKSPSAVLGAAVSAMSNKHKYTSPVAKRLGLSPSQEDAMTAEGRVVMAAGAGSGKTRVLAGKVVYHMEEKGLTADQIMACSFTKKSSVELVDRVRSYGGVIAKNNPLGFGTVHSVALRMFLQYGGKMVKGDRNIVSGYRQMELIKLAILQVLMDPETDVAPPVADSFFDYEEGGSEAAPEPEQDDGIAGVLRALELAENSYKWMASNYGASRWLTQTLDGIDQYRLRPVPPSEMTKDQKDWINRTLGYAVRPSDKPRRNTLRQLERGGMAGYRVASEDQPGWIPKIQKKYPYWSSHAANQWFNLGYSWEEDFKTPMGKKKVPIPLGQFALYISKKKGNLVTPGADAVEKGEEQDTTVFTAVYAAYEWLKANEEQFANSNGDFSDMLLNASKVMIANPSVRKRIQKRFRMVLVDEAQDLNKAQHLFVGLVAGTYDPETQLPSEDEDMSADTLAFIGDDFQAIYAFRGADPQQFVEKTEQGFDTKLLTMNYRSGSAIVSAANSLIAHNKKQIKKVCDANPNNGEGNIEEVVLPHEGQLGHYCAETVADMVDHADSSYKDFGIAVRTNREAYQYGMALIEKGIPFRSKMNFFKGPSMSVLHMMQLADLGEDAYTVPGSVVNPTVLGILKAANWGVGHKPFVADMPKGRNWMKYLSSGGGQSGRNRRLVGEFYDYLHQLTQLKAESEEELTTQGIFNWVLNAPLGRDSKSVKDEMMDRVRENPLDMEEVMSTAGKGSGNLEEAVEDYALAPLSVIEKASSSYPDLQSFVSYMGELQKANGKLFTDDSDKDNIEKVDIDAVQIDTVHGWKGLEAKHMFLPMYEADSGGFPHSRTVAGDALDDALMTSIEDERRLAYVAITRGEESVTILRPLMTDRDKETSVSRFVTEACIPRKMSAKEATSRNRLESLWGDFLVPDEPY